MASGEHVCELYARHAVSADICIVEGMMGMFDGYDRDRGSSAEIAQLLQLPVVLVVDAKSAAYSMAPLLSGFIHFRPDIRIAGVIFNRVGSPRHYEMLREVCAEIGITCLGYLPKEKVLEQESRYLGLDFSRSKGTDAIGILTRLLEQCVDWKLLLAKTAVPLRETRERDREFVGGRKPGNLRILVARNEESFSFIYEEHLEMLQRNGSYLFLRSGKGCPHSAGHRFVVLAGRVSRKTFRDACRSPSGERIRSGVYRARRKDAGRVWRNDLPFVCHRL